VKLRVWIKLTWPFIPIVLALLVTFLILILFNTSPKTALDAMIEGSFGDKSKVLQVLAFLIPLLLSASGLLVTFTAGLWNIGVEGQIIIGAIMASWVALKIDLPTPLQITLELLAAMAGGALWAGIVALLKTRVGVNEIFSGLALNNLAIILTNFLISGPWQPPEGGTFRGTQPFAENALLPRLGESRFSPLSLVFSLVAFGMVVIALRGHFGG
jgi:simple sugar transport system permease protein